MDRELIEAGRADLKVVFDLLEDLRKAWEQILNNYAEGITSMGNLPTERGGVRYLDAWMTGHNFYKLLLDNLVADANLTGEAAAQFYLGASATFRKAMEVRAEQMRRGEKPIG